ncbi:hypothetical protein CGMCC3_g8492 [Colletotrichum fructicola]|nr:uncharacterized protein CGMCC3_g8492 [Colletotrichum fructicola]KAE9575569.1 hypothetical protein CGMCC3_g8492 [Colletotrichum fructicola]KAF4411346.1 hypothetical protein CFRS1_v006255 [Colletotrichum fructicola]KAF4905183.1 hypothetical protein CGCFRS4_v000744 [Colletotrichum fructicola]
MSQSDTQMVPMEPITEIDPARDILMYIRDGKSIRKLEINSRYLPTVYWPFPAILGQPLIYQRTEGPVTVIAHVNMCVNGDDDYANELYFTMLCLHHQGEPQQAPTPVERLYNLARMANKYNFSQPFVLDREAMF